MTPLASRIPSRYTRLVPDPVPRIKHPMAATQVASPFHRDGWVWEEKYDGWRVIAYKDGAAGHLVSRNGKDLIRRFAELAAVGRLPAWTLLLDGEVARFDTRLISRFEWLRGRPQEQIE